MPIVHNVQRVRKTMQDRQARYKLRTRQLAREAGAEGRENVRKNISKPRFPGYAITGGLARKVVASEPKKDRGGWTVDIKIQLTGKQKKYAMIHEKGGIIRVKKAKYLTFFIPGVGWRRAKKVKIRAKHYFRDGIAKLRREFTLNRIRAGLR